MPAEWEPHEATWLSWPHNPETWPETPLEEIENIWLRMVGTLSSGEWVRINVSDAVMEQRARSLLQDAKVDLNKVQFFHFPTNDAWARDHGPIFIIDESRGENQLVLLDWEFNSWGNKYPPFDLDNQIPKKIANALNLPMMQPGMVLEGGSIEVNGSGILMTTESCLLHPNRNPELDQKKIEETLSQYLGVNHFLWLGDGIVGDDTDGHIDDICRFVKPNTILTVLEEDPEDENYPALQDNLRRLQMAKNASGQSFEIITLPMPDPVYGSAGRLPASYANFYIGNEVVLVPVFQEEKDQKALEILQKCFPGRQMVPIPSRTLVGGLGACHCVTQQQPSIQGS